MNTLILAAGLGTRLRPITEKIPKPMVFIKPNIRAIDMQLAQLRSYGTIFINTHYCHTVFENYLQNKNVTLHYEKKLLGTAGPLAQVFESSPESLLVVNSDIIHDIDIQAFLDYSKSKEIVLAMVNDPATNTLEVNDDKLVGIKNKFNFGRFNQQMTFAGMSYYSSNALSKISIANFDIRNIWKKQLETQCDIFCYTHKGWWLDMGTPKGLWKTVKSLNPSRENLNLSDKTHNFPPQQIAYDIPLKNHSAQGIWADSTTFWDIP